MTHLLTHRQTQPFIVKDTTKERVQEKKQQGNIDGK